MAAKKRSTKKKAASKTRKARIPKSWAAMARMMDRVGKKFDTIPKSKKRGLSGSPEHHRAQTSSHRDSAQSFFNDAARDASIGECYQALADLANGMYQQGQGQAHADEGGVAKYASTIDSDRAIDRVERLCIVKRGASTLRSLSGMRRRARR